MVQGTTKADLAVDRSIPAIHRRIGARGDFSIQSSFAELLLVVQGVVQMQRASGEKRPVPLVYGSAIETNCRPAVEAIITEYRGELGKLVNLEDPRCAEQVATKGQFTVSQVYQAGFKELISALVTTRTPPGSVQFEIRDYAGCRVTTGQDREATTQATHLIVSRELREKFNELYQADCRRTRDCRAELRQLTVQIATLFSRHSFLARDEQGKIVNRFISANSTTSLDVDGDIRNLIFLDSELRQIYTDTYMRQLNIQHNVCFKSALDKVCPPFADIAGTHLADLMDERDGTKPCAVLTRP